MPHWPRCRLTLTFTGTLNDKLAGFYRSKYTRDGVDKYLATTQFEAADARRALPCFDEPNMKATFKVRRPPARAAALGWWSPQRGRRCSWRPRPA